MSNGQKLPAVGYHRYEQTFGDSSLGLQRVVAERPADYNGTAGKPKYRQHSSVQRRVPVPSFPNNKLQLSRTLAASMTLLVL
jgi:hypothetical protein